MASPRGTRNKVGAIAILAKGSKITTGATPISVAIEPTQYKSAPANRVRICATAAAYVRIGVQTIDITVAGTGYVVGEVLTLVGGTGTAMTATATTFTIASAAVNAAGSGYAKDDTITLTGGTFTAAGVLDVATVQLVAADINLPGTGYAVGDAQTLVGGTFGTAAVLTAVTTQLVSAATNAPGTGYVNGEIITTAGGTSSVAAALTVATTQVVSATINAGGTGDLGDGAGVIVEGTTGTGTPFRASVTISSNAIASIQSISVAGAYTVNPTDIAEEPVIYISGAASGTELTGATLIPVMGVLTTTISTPGSYTVESAALTQASTDGAGTGATFDTGLFGLLTASITTPGSYTVNSATFTCTSDGGGTGATFDGGLFGVLTTSLNTGGVYSLTTVTEFTQSATSGSGTAATFDTGLYGIASVTELLAGAYSAYPGNPAATTADGSGTNCTLTVNRMADAAAGDLMLGVDDSIILDAVDLNHVSAVQVSGSGIVQISPIEN